MTAEIEKLKNRLDLDSNITLKSKGLFSILLYHVDKPQSHKIKLAEYCKDKRDSIASSLNELHEAGYINKTQNRANGGLYNGYNIWIDKKLLKNVIIDKKTHK